VYLGVLAVMILGYAVAGRGFAYLGAPPIFVGEVVLVLGLAVAAWEGAVARALGTPALGALVALMLWVVIRTIPYLSIYRVDAARDAMLAGYGLFAIVVASLLLARPARMAGVVRAAGKGAAVVVAVGWVVYLVVRQAPELLPAWPWADGVRVVEIKPGDLLVHLAAATALIVAGFRRSHPALLALLVVGVAVGMIGNRGGMVGYAAAMVVLAVMKPPGARFGRLGVAVVVVVCVALLAGPSALRTNEGSRVLGLEQITENVRSIAGASRSQALSSTTEWRLQWWSRIVDYTVGGPFAAGGKGFGINLASDDGFRVDTQESLRSPHNVTMTYLARGGIPALALWLLVQACWFGAVTRAWLAAKRERQSRWMGLLAVCSCLCVAALVNASFDVHLEGPMGAIPYWTAFGVGLAAARLRRTHPNALDGLEEGPLPPPPPVPRSWSW
jgi:hypothetical protein